MQSEITFKAGGYRCVAARSDKSWGHGLKVSIFDLEGLLLNVVTFACHPEFPAYETLQTMSTEKLIELAANQLNTGELEESLVKARQADLQLYVRFEI
jgi:hypothetical protein